MTHIEVLRHIAEEILEETSKERRLSKVVEALRAVYDMGKNSK